MPRRSRSPFVFAPAMLFCLCVACGTAWPPERLDIRIVDEDALRAVLTEARGDVVVLNFWATWCAPCVEELPHFARLVESYGERGLRVITVSFDDPETIESRVRPFVEERDYPFTYLVKTPTNGDEYESFVNAIDPSWLGNVPATFIYDTSGQLHAVSHEPVTYSQLRGAVEPLLSPEPVTRASNPARDSTAAQGAR